MTINPYKMVQVHLSVNHSPRSEGFTQVSNIMSERGERLAKRPRRSPSDSPVSYALELFMEKLRGDREGWAVKGEVEFEVRIGRVMATRYGGRQERAWSQPGHAPRLVSPEDRMRDNLRFEPGVTPDEYRHMEGLLRDDDKFECESSKSTAFNMPNRERIIESSDGSFTKEFKEKIQIRVDGPTRCLHHCLFPCCC